MKIFAQSSLTIKILVSVLILTSALLFSYYSLRPLVLQSSYPVQASPVSQPISIELLASPPPIDVNQFDYNKAVERIVVDPGSGTKSVSNVLTGSNLGIWVLGRLNLSSVVPLVRQIKPGLLRFPAGEIADSLVWTRNNSLHWFTPPGGPGYLKGWLTPKDIDAAFEFANATGASLIIQVNARLGDVGLAADMVRYANVEKGYGVKYWEIGNEPELWYVKHPASKDESAEAFDPVIFAERLARYASAMKAVDSSIKILAPACTVFPLCKTWFEAIKRNPDALRLVDFSSVHLYGIDNSSMLDGFAYYAGSEGDFHRSSHSRLNYGWNALRIPLQGGNASELGVVLNSKFDTASDYSKYYAAVDYAVIGNLVLHNSKTGEYGEVAVDALEWRGSYDGFSGNVLTISPYVKDSEFKFTQGQAKRLSPGWQVVSMPISGSTKSLYQAGLLVRNAGNGSTLFVKRVFLSGPNGNKTIADFSDSKAMPFLARAYSISPEYQQRDKRLFHDWNVVSAPASGKGGETTQIAFQLISQVFDGEGVFSVRNLYLVDRDGSRKRIPLDGFEPLDAAYSLTVEENEMRVRFTSKYPGRKGDLIATVYKPMKEDWTTASRFEAEIRLETPVSRAVDGFGSPSSNVSESKVDGKNVLALAVPSGSAELASLLAEDATGFEQLNFEVLVPGESFSPVSVSPGQVYFTYNFSFPGSKLARFYSSREAIWNGFDELEARVFVPYTASARDRSLVESRFEYAYPFLEQNAPGKPIAVTEYGPYYTGPGSNANAMAGAIWTLKALDDFARYGTALALSYNLIDSAGYGLITPEGRVGKRYYTFLLNSMTEQVRVPIQPSDPAVFVSARVSENHSIATLVLINEHNDQSKKFTIAIPDSTITSAAAWLLDVDHDASPVNPNFSGNEASIELPPYSAVLVRLELAT